MYTAYSWSAGDVISPARLNNIETQYTEAIAANGQIPTGALAAGAITQSVSATKATSFSTSSTSYVDITGWSLSITTTGGTLMITVSGDVMLGNASSFGIAAVRVNGVDYPICTSPGTNTRAPLAGVVFVTGLAAGTYTVQARLKAVSGASVNAPDGVSTATMTAVEFKK